MLKLSSIFKRVPTNIVYSLMLRLISIASAFFMSMFVAKFFTIHDSGLILFFLSLVAIVVSLSVRGFDIAISKIAAENGDGLKTLGYLYYIFKRVIPVGIIISLFVFFFLFTYKGVVLELNLFVPIIIIITISHVVMQIMSFYYQGISKLTMTILCQRTLFNIVFCFTIGFGFIVYNNKLNLIYAFSSIAFSSFIILLFIIVYTALSSGFKYQSVVKGKQYFQFLNLQKNSYPVSIVQLISMYLVQLLLFMLSSPQDLAGYMVAVKISSVMAIAILASTNVVVPKIVKAYKNNEITKLDTIYLESIKFASFMGIPCATMIFIFGYEILGFFGESYKSYYIVLCILTGSQLINCITGSSDMVLTYIGGEVEHKRNVIAGMFVCALLSIVLIPLYSALGAAISAAISAITTNALDYISINLRKKVLLELT
ncbi:MATE family efflux transporter [Photobacterium leiognathi]|uniref:polysaccharide biosynthesis C-terminal domain-containing protein n=1 Tax=Photobacterium leiognathi TaxID=553611 RepID=UPI002980B609|nr:polysaccharide biosynthesis C-terminal domain-containing protein [Photobacterium leiognathi]